jgi:hypothetical protein
MLRLGRSFETWYELRSGRIRLLRTAVCVHLAFCSNKLSKSNHVFFVRFSSALESVLRGRRAFELRCKMRPGKLHGLRGPGTARVLGRHPFHDRVCGAVSEGGGLRDDVYTSAEHPAGVCAAEAAAGDGCFGEGLER